MVEVVHGPVPAAEPVVRTGADGGRDVVLGLVHGRLERFTMRQEGGDGRGERAAGPVVVAGGDALPGQGDHPVLRAEVEQVRAVGPLAVAALDQDAAPAVSGELARGGLHVRGRADGAAHKHLGLGEVRRDHVRERHEVLADGADSVVPQQPVAALGDHDGVEDDVARAEARQLGRDRADQLGRVEHPDLHRVRPDVLEDRRDLRGRELRRHRVNPPHSLRVLGRERRDRRHPVAAEGRERLEIGLDAGPAAAVRAGDRQHPAVGAGRLPAVSVCHARLL